MFEFEDMSSGFHDVFLNKYADSSGPILDFYISDSMQDMLDIDIRTEVATVVGGSNEFTSLVNDLPSLDLDINSNDGEIAWLGGPKWSAANDIYADVGACVNPNSVMPIITTSVLNSPKAHLNLNTNNYHASCSPLPSPKEKKSHLTFSPNQIKVPSVQDIKRPSQLTTEITTVTSVAGKKSPKNQIESVKKDLIKEYTMHNKKTNTIIQSNILSGTNTIKLAPGIGGLTFANSLAYAKLKQTSSNLTVSSTSSSGGNLLPQIKRERDSSPHHHINNGNALNGTNNIYNNNNNQISSPKITSRNILVQNKNNISNTISNGTHVTNGSNNSLTKNKVKSIEHEFPKPAYSYSCLIAMALKNSRSGSLPVSEIYSFMCEHFPYFKTAPNGWKNSVRHNLSLNKCFEKIEKPATNGGQRKGCLWAMNPTKISKMDEEVQKWSRKDPMAIRKAMVYPEHLEALERGEMKHGSTGDSDGENDIQSDVEENSDSELDEQLVETSESIDEDEEEREKEFDIEVTDIYDSIDISDSKEAHQMSIRQNELIEISVENENSGPKRARLDINYAIGPAGAFEHQMQQRPTQQHHSRRKMQLVNRIV